ncbi:glutathione S-transferase N-terminal domain-containing protein [Levilactobacillus fujinensis]|uniref:Glutathione S-transferase N-terminal domain-containing protein n=1 Tax=Levilactobacillus fujinensis TaxID=2486024 RepID=A0ABW1TFE0_9LACO|nr:glutathione S-transferase N-terminal domain-containing protein [Levilactobacillus fujinensis]
MMKLTLFYAAGASPMAAHILLEELGLPYQLEKVNLDNKTWSQGNYNLLNPKSYVPALKVDDQPLLTECAVILEFIGNQSKFMPQYATPAYWKQRAWLNYIATELHKNFISPFRPGNWLPNTTDSKQLVWTRVQPRLAFVEHQLAASGPYLLGDTFSVADSYLFVMTNWMKRLGYNFVSLPQLEKFDSLMRQRAAVQRVFQQEGAPHSLVDGE